MDLISPIYFIFLFIGNGMRQNELILSARLHENGLLDENQCAAKVPGCMHKLDPMACAGSGREIERRRSKR